MIGTDPSGLPLAVAEGVADAMAIVSLRGGLSVALSGTASFQHDGIAHALARSPAGVLVCSDGDGAGRAAGKKLKRAIRIAGGRAALWDPDQQGYPGRDPADVAAAEAARTRRTAAGREGGEEESS